LATCGPITRNTAAGPSTWARSRRTPIWFNAFLSTYHQLEAKYPGRQIVVTETGWPTTFGPIPSQQAPVGISNARDYLTRVSAWAQAQQVVLYIHNMFDDQFGVDTSSPFNYHFGLIDYTGKSKGILF
jgi:exo-beta-1,3-glucanase (GH17 family)